MFLLEPGRTAYDLNLRVFGVDVRVHPMFWLIGAIMQFGLLQYSIALFLVWMACLFVSILVHELGHAFMGRLCGTDSHIVLYAFGGVTVPHRHLPVRWQRIAVFFAGPLAGFLLLACVIAAGWFLNAGQLALTAIGLKPDNDAAVPLNPLVDQAFLFLFFINLIWGLVNLLPVWPLDGGQISREIFDGFMPHGRGIVVSLSISLVLAALVAVQCFTAAYGHPLIPFLSGYGSSYTGVMFGLLAFESFQLLQQARQIRRRPWDDDY